MVGQVSDTLDGWMERHGLASCPRLNEVDGPVMRCAEITGSATGLYQKLHRAKVGSDSSLACVETTMYSLDKKRKPKVEAHNSMMLLWPLLFVLI